MRNGILGDGSLIILERETQTIPYQANSIVSREIRIQPNLIKELLLHVKFTLTCSQIEAAGIAAQMNPRFPFALLKNITLRASNGVALKNLPGDIAHIISVFNSGRMADTNFYELITAAQISNDLFALGKEVYFDIPIAFDDPMLMKHLKERTILNTNEYNNLDLALNWGDVSDVVGDYNDFYQNDFAISNCECEVISVERLPMDDDDMLLNRQRLVDSYQEKSYVLGTEAEFFLPENTLVDTNIITLLAEFTFPNPA